MGIFLQQTILIVVGFLTFLFEVNHLLKHCQKKKIPPFKFSILFKVTSFYQTQLRSLSCLVTHVVPGAKCLKLLFAGDKLPRQGDGVSYFDAGDSHHLNKHSAGERNIKTKTNTDKGFFRIFHHIKVTKGLPSTPYYKMIDYWLLFTMNIMVYTLAFHTFLQVQDTERFNVSFSEQRSILIM